MWRKVIRALAMLVDRDERVGKGERVLTEVFASDPAVLEAVVMIRSSPLPGFNTRVVWQSFGTHWQIEVQERNLKKRQEPPSQRTRPVSEALFREVMSKAREWAAKGKPKSGMITDGANYSVAWGTPGRNSLALRCSAQGGQR